jgi:hypothetical protein
MAFNTYVALRKETVAVATNTVTLDLTGISGYKDLRVVINGGSSATTNVTLRYNADSTSGLYSYTFLTGDSSNASTGRAADANQIYCNYYGYMDSSFRTNVLVDIFQFANASVFKTNISRSNNSANGTAAVVGLWRNTNAITSVSFVVSENFAVGTTFSVYGIASEGTTPAPKATGGAIYSDSSYYYHVFGASGLFTPSEALTVDYLVIAGGGGGSTNEAGGGGAGGLRSTLTATGGLGLLETPLSLNSGTQYTVTVGGGGAAAGTAGVQGSNSVFASITSTGGGGGGNGGQVGTTGGSGGGGGANGASSGGARTASPIQGFAGGSGSFVNGGAAGGGGAGAVGMNGSGTYAGNGGAGLELPLFATATGTGVNNYYAGGGGGGAFTGSTQSTGGLGGGGNGGAGSPTAGSAAFVNTGSGGGGGGTGGSIVGGAGSSGLVIVRYAK